MFQLKDFTSIAASMINWMKATQTKVTDFNIGGVARALVEAPAAEIDELYQQYFHGLREAIPVSVYNSFDFTRLPAAPAAGLVRVTIQSQATATTIPAASTFTPAGSGVVYAATADVTIAAGDTYGDVPVAASVAGAAGNLPAATAFTLAPAPPGFQSAANSAPFLSGRDEETDAERKIRFSNYILTLSHTTLRGLEYGLLTTALYDTAGNLTERVVSVSLVEPYLDDVQQPVALVHAYIHNGVGTTSPSLVTRASEVVHGYYDAAGKPVTGWKAAGVRVTVEAATEVQTDVTAELTVALGYDADALIAEAEAVVAAYVLGLGVGKPLILAEMTSRVMDIDGVTNFVLSAPAADVAADPDEKIMPDAITLTEA